MRYAIKLSGFVAGVLALAECGTVAATHTAGAAAIRGFPAGGLIEAAAAAAVD